MSPTVTNYIPQIWFNGTNVTGKTVPVIVGQQINLVNTLGVLAPGTAMFSWSVPGPTESQFFVSEDLWQTNGRPIALTLTDSNIVSFFWVMDGTYAVTCTNKFPGTTNTLSTTFKVLRPTDINVATTTGLVSVGVDFKNIFAMIFGDTNIGAAGITFSNSPLTMPTGFTNYEIQWVQLITSWQATITNTNSLTGVVPHILQTNGQVLDTFCPYFGRRNLNYVDDSPDISLQKNNEIGAVMSATFKMWLMFQPTNGNWVPLWDATWNCSGTAIGHGLVPDQWALSGTNISILSRGDAGTNYPSWTNNIRNCINFYPFLR
jgi:hypothetical protein